MPSNNQAVQAMRPPSSNNAPTTGSASPVPVWRTTIPAVATPRLLHDLVFSKGPGGLNLFEQGHSMVPLEFDPVLCFVAIKTWQLHGEFLTRLLSCVDRRREPGTKAKYESLASWIYMTPEDDNWGPLAWLGVQVLFNRKEKDLWTWTCTNWKVSEEKAHDAIHPKQNRTVYRDFPKPGISDSEVENYKQEIEKLRTASAYVLKHYEAVYKRLERLRQARASAGPAPQASHVATVTKANTNATNFGHS